MQCKCDGKKSAVSAVGVSYDRHSSLEIWAYVYAVEVDLLSYVLYYNLELEIDIKYL